jgi:hypothetical protein
MRLIAEHAREGEVGALPFEAGARGVVSLGPGAHPLAHVEVVKEARRDDRTHGPERRDLASCGVIEAEG